MLVLKDKNIQYQHLNERDIEIPFLINSLRRVDDSIDSLLDVGAHYSFAHYAPQIKQMLGPRIYTAVDILPDEKTEAIVDEYLIGNVNHLEIDPHDFVCCISTLEHCGISTYKVGDYKLEQLRTFRRLLDLTLIYGLASFPFGTEGLYPGEYSNITIPMFREFNRIISQRGFETQGFFFYNEFPQGGKEWSLIDITEAANVPMDASKGVQCVGLLEWFK